jgi:hypothetical protein
VRDSAKYALLRVRRSANDAWGELRTVDHHVRLLPFGVHVSNPSRRAAPLAVAGT